MSIKDRIAQYAKQEGIDFSTAAAILGKRGAAGRRRTMLISNDEKEVMDAWLKDQYYKPYTYNPDMRGDK